MKQATPVYPWLCIEPFLADFVGARALSSAFELGLIGCLESGAQPDAALREQLGLDARGLHMLLSMLKTAGVVEGDECGVALTERFRAALDFRDLLEARLRFAHLVAPDFLHLSNELLADPSAFFNHARLFELFSYDRCFDFTPDNFEATARWMRITTTLTRYEAQACIDAFDFSRFTRQLDVGGNSGEFLLRVCRAHTALSGTVYDLPVVCEIGRTHIGKEPEAGRIAFVATHSRDEPLPAGHDLISFKSMLHDWPEAEMRAFLARAYAALEPGGSVLIFEREWSPALPPTLNYGTLPLLLFFRSYREPLAYRSALAHAGFHSIEVRRLKLETPFVVISARK